MKNKNLHRPIIFFQGTSKVSKLRGSTPLNCLHSAPKHSEITIIVTAAPLLNIFYSTMGHSLYNFCKCTRSNTRHKTFWHWHWDRDRLYLSIVSLQVTKKNNQSIPVSNHGNYMIIIVNIFCRSFLDLILRKII